MRPFCTAISPPQAIARLELDNLAEIENSVENEMGCDDYHKHMTIAELRDNFADDIWDNGAVYMNKQILQNCTLVCIKCSKNQGCVHFFLSVRPPGACATVIRS